MIPSNETELSPDLPTAARYWTPKRSEIDEEGFGFFRDVWPIFGVTRREASQILAADQASAALTDALAANAAEFDVIARAIENRSPEEANLTIEQATQIDEFVDPDDFSPIGGLEIGVAGLSYALSAAGMFPAASCRGHLGPHAWSEVPVVLLATDRRRAEILQPLVEEAGGGFDIDVARSELLVVRGRSIVDTMRLAALVLRAANQFRPPKRPRRTRPPWAGEQGSLF